MTAQHVVAEVVERSPALGSNMPTRAETERESERLVDQALTQAAKNLAWARRHTDLGHVTNDVVRRAQALLDSRDVWVLEYAACECAGDDRLRVESWHVTEAERDAALDTVVASVEASGDVVTWYTLGLPKRLGDLADESVSQWVAETGPGSSSAHQVVEKRYGTCPDCGRSENPPSDAEALDRIAALVADGSVDYGEVESRIEAVLRETGRLRSEDRPVIGPDVDRWDEDGDEGYFSDDYSTWVRSLYREDL